MSSEEIDSTTKQENGGAQFPANTTASISANSQKRKLSQDDSSSDDAKRLRANNGGANNAPASSNTDAAPQIVVGEQGPPAVSGSADPAAVVKVEIKEEPAEHAEEGTEVKTEPDEAAVKEEATSSVRDSCQYGIKCYRGGKWNILQLKLFHRFANSLPVWKRTGRKPRRSKNNMWNDLCIQMNKLAPPQHSMKTWKKIWLRYVQTRLLRLDTQKMIAPNPVNEENQTEKENASTETKSNQSNTSDSSVGSRTYDTDSGITSSHITNESVDINKQAIESDENRMKDQNLDQQIAVQIQNTDLGVVSSHIANKAAEINENCMKNHQDQGLQSDIGAQTNNTDLIMAPSPIPNESESCINSELQGDRDEVTSTIVIDDDDDVIVERNRTDFTTKAPKASADHLTKSENQSENDYFTSLIEVLGEANTIAEEELKVIRTLERNQEKYRKEKLEIFEKEVLAIEAKVESLEKKQAKVIIL